MATLPVLPLGLVLLLPLPLTYIAIIYFHSYRKLSSFGGPFLASISNLWLFKQSLNHHQQDALMEVLNKHGPYARIGPNMLVTNDPDLLRHMSAPRSPWTRGGWYEIHKFDSTTDNIFSTIDEKKHASLRGKLGPAVCYSAELLLSNASNNLLRPTSLKQRHSIPEEESTTSNPPSSNKSIAWYPCCTATTPRGTSVPWI